MMSNDGRNAASPLTDRKASSVKQLQRDPWLPSQGVDGAARTARSAEQQALPFIDPRLLCPRHIPPDKAQNWFIGWQQTYLVEHTFEIAAYHNWILAEPK